MTREEALVEFRDELPDILVALRDNRDYRLSQEQVTRHKNFDRWWVATQVHLLRKQMIRDQFDPTIYAIERHLSPKATDISPELITRAKAFPIQDLVGKRGKKILCPLHEEQTPSFVINKHNKFRCYGCDEYGDVIDLYQKMYGVDFKTAVTALT